MSDGDARGRDPIPEADLLADLKRVGEQVDGPLTTVEYDERGEFCAATYRNRFGSFDAAKERVGLQPSPRGGMHTVADETLVEDIQRVASEIDRTPTPGEYNERGDHSPTTVRNHFGSWTAAISEAGLPPRTPIKKGPDVPDEDLLADIANVASELGKTPSRHEYNAHGEYSSSTARQRFGSWSEACVTAGLEPNGLGQEKIEVEKTGIALYTPEKRLLDRARELMEEQHGEKVPLHLAVAHLSELYIDEFGGGDADAE